MSNFPRQKLPISQKDKAWQKGCIDSSISLSLDSEFGRRSPRWKKHRNYELYNGRFDHKDLEYVTSPYNLSEQGLSFPANMQMYPIHIPIFDLLFGEETKRPFNYIVKTVNDSSISVKQSEYQDNIKDKLFELVMAEMEEDDFETKYESLIRDSKYSFKSANEINSTRLLKYFEQDCGVRHKFRRGWEDALLAGEEIYKVDLIHGAPNVRRCNPLEIGVILPHNEEIIDKADAIVEDTWRNLSEVIDEFGEELTSTQISDLEDRFRNGGAQSVPSNAALLPPPKAFSNSGSAAISNSTPWYDVETGAIRVCYVTWKSLKKVYIRTYLDEMGTEQEDLVAENYKKQPNDIKLKTTWINEYWEGVKISDNIYLEAKPKQTQFRRMDNIYECSSGYVGTVYNCNNSQSVSLMDRIVPWLYMYMIIFYNTEIIISSNYGTITLIDTTLIPDGWDVDKWLYYAKSMKIGWVDSMTERNKGALQGKQNQSQHSKNLNMDIGNTISQYVQLLEFIEGKLKELSGITDQRMGAISSSEKVGNTQRSVVQSSHITEKWFELHNWTKQRVMTTLLEVAKDWVGEDTKRLQYVTGDLAPIMFEVKGDEYCEDDYGVFISNSSKDAEDLETLKGLMHAAMQNDQVSLADVARTLGNNSMAEIRESLGDAQEKREQQGAAAQKKQEEMEKLALEQQEREISLKERTLEKDMYKIDADNQTKLQVAAMSKIDGADGDEDNDGVEDDIELTKHRENLIHKRDELNEKIRANKRNEDLKAKQIAKTSNSSNKKS